MNNRLYNIHATSRDFHFSRYNDIYNLTENRVYVCVRVMYRRNPKTERPQQSIDCIDSTVLDSVGPLS